MLIPKTKPQKQNETRRRFLPKAKVPKGDTFFRTSRRQKKAPQKKWWKARFQVSNHAALS